MNAATRTPHPPAKGPSDHMPGSQSATAKALAAALADAARDDWAALAACGDGYPKELFWPAGEGVDARALVAREVCRGCPVRGDCLDYAEDVHEPTDMSMGGGIWGGLLGRERDRIRCNGWHPGDRLPLIPLMTSTQAREALESEWGSYLPAAFLAGVAARWQAEQREAS